MSHLIYQASGGCSRDRPRGSPHVMLEYTESSLFDSPAQTLVNAVNTVGVMGRGIALEFKRRYPEMFARYKEQCDSGRLWIGSLHLYQTDHHWVLNFPTKEHWRQPSKPEWIEKGLQEFVREFAALGITSASFPQLGCGSGGLDWEQVVKPMMEKYLAVLSIPVYVHVLRFGADSRRRASRPRGSGRGGGHV